LYCRPGQASWLWLVNFDFCAAHKACMQVFRCCAPNPARATVKVVAAVGYYCTACTIMYMSTSFQALERLSPLHPGKHLREQRRTWFTGPTRYEPPNFGSSRYGSRADGRIDLNRSTDQSTNAWAVALECKCMPCMITTNPKTSTRNPAMPFGWISMGVPMAWVGSLGRRRGP